MADKSLPRRKTILNKSTSLKRKVFAEKREHVHVNHWNLYMNFDTLYAEKFSVWVRKIQIILRNMEPLKWIMIGYLDRICYQYWSH